ncbi:MFS general substrate transporter [Hypoxylon sp. NC1633]|nr:MFS general substrate transporter [Hypoxylon sp. NC1633]
MSSTMAGGNEQHRRDSNELTEASPLLADQRPRRPSHRPTLSVTSLTNVHMPKVHNGHTIVYLLCAICFVSSCGTGFVGIPVTRILEDVLCRKYYDTKTLDTPIDERLCKVNSIQEQVAFIMAIQTSLNAIFAFFAAFPWGLLADRIGRKPVVVINLTGILLDVFWVMTVLYFRMFPIELIWIGSVGSLIGGGRAVTTGILLSMATDSTTEEERSVAFMRIHVASLCGVLLSPTLSSVMMQQVGPWPPIWVAVGTVVISAIAFVFVPETLKHKSKSGPDESAPEPEAEADEDDAKLKPRAPHIFTKFRESLSILKSRSLILLLLTGLGSTPVVDATSSFMAQFVSKRYHMILAQTGYVQTSYGVAQIIQGLVILPWVTRYLMKSTTPARLRAADEHHRDLFIARGSFGFLIAGIFILGLAPNLPSFIVGLVIMALGSSFGSLVWSLMSLYIDPEHRSRLFSLVGMVQTVGSIYSQPFLAALFALGMKLGGGGWIGLPYYGLAILVTVTGCLTFFVRVPRGARESRLAQEEDGEQD